MLIQVSRTYSAFGKQSIKITLLFFLPSLKAARFSVSMPIVGESAISQIPECKLGSLPVSSRCTINRVTVLRPGLGFYMYLTFFPVLFCVQRIVYKVDKQQDLHSPLGILSLSVG